MVILGTFAICIAVTIRTSAERSIASQQFFQMQGDVEKLRNTNQSLKMEIQRLSSDPRTIEAAARSRLNMVRANEIVVPVE